MTSLTSFFKRSQGKWISQRTTYELSSKDMNSIQSYMKIESDKILNNSSSIASLNWGASSRRILNNLYDQNSIPEKYKFILKFTNRFNTETLNTLCTITDASLINFKTRYGSTTIDETYWFATNNLRLSTSIIKQFNICVAVSFCSEIKV